MSRSDRATVLRINSVGAVGAQVAPGRVVFEHRAEDHEQRAHAGGERANTRVGQAASTDGRGYRARDAGGAQSASIPKSARSTISTTSAIPIHPPFPSFRHSCAPSVIPAPPPSFLRPLRHSCAPSVIPAPPPPFLRPLRHSCGGRNPCDRPTVRRASIRHSHPSAIPAPPPSFLRRQESMRPPNRATSLHPPFPSFRHSCAPFRHSCAPSVIPAEAGIHATAQPCDEPPSAIPILPPFLRPSVIPAPPPSFLRPSVIPAPPPSFLRPSVIPAEAGIHATAQPCDEPPSAIPILPSFLRPLRHSCGGRNPRDRPTVRRASIRPTAHQSPQRAAGDRAPSNIGSALDPTDRMDSCLRRNDGQAGVTEGRV